MNYNNVMIDKYLVCIITLCKINQKKNINPSIYIIRKIINSFIPYKDYLKEQFNPPNRNSIAQIYEKLFYEIIKSYTLKKNYTELPFYLNYLILKSHPLFEKFFIQKVIETGEFKTELNESNTNYEILKYVCKNFDNLFIKYTNYGSELLIKLQLIQFYKLQPPQAKIISDYMTVLKNNEEYKLNKIKENKNLTGEVLDDYSNPQHLNNPFMSRLNQASDIYPIGNKTLFTKSKINL